MGKIMVASFLLTHSAVICAIRTAPPPPIIGRCTADLRPEGYSLPSTVVDQSLAVMLATANYLRDLLVSIYLFTPKMRKADMISLIRVDMIDSGRVR